MANDRKIPVTPRPTAPVTQNPPQGNTGGDWIKDGLNTMRDFASGIVDMKAQNPNGINRPVSGMDTNKTMTEADKIINHN